ncbi:retrovirus-related pol polyprotein from transposon TNT 1-94 [Tanacetum coccineum]
MTGNRKLFSSNKAYNEGNVIFGSNLRGNIIGKGKICDNKCRVTFSEHDSEITKDGKVIGRGIRKKGLYVMKLGNKPKDQICLATIDENSSLWHRRLGHVNMRLIQSLASKELVRNLPKLKFGQHFCDACKIRKQAHTSHKAKNIVSTTRCLELLHMDLFGPFAVRSYGGNRYTLVIVDDYSRKVEESLNVTLDKTPPPSKTSPLVDDDLDEEEAIKVTEKKNLENDIVDKTLEIDEIVNIKESRNHTLENVIENLNQRTLRSQAQNQSNFFCFISTIEPKNVNEALTDDSWMVTIQEELNQLIANDVWELVPQPRNMTIIGTKWVFRNKLDENGIVSRNKASLKLLAGSLEDITRRVPYDQRNNPPQNSRIVYPPSLNINYFRHFLDIIRNYDPIDDEPMWAVDRVVALTPGSAITIPKTANEFAIKVTTAGAKVNAASIKVTIAQRLRLLKEFLLSEKG